jgi:hypothetical protein
MNKGETNVSSAQHTSLESSIRAMNEALARLSNQVAATDSSTESSSDLWTIVHRPGWTTIAEAALVEAMAVSITRHAESLTHTHKALVEGALAVGRDS